MSPMSPSTRAAPDGPIPLSSRSALPVAAPSVNELLVRGFDFSVGDGQFLNELLSELVAGLGDDAHRWRRGP